MRASRFFSSGHPHSQDPSNEVDVGVGVPIPPKSSHRIREFFRIGRPHSSAPPQADPHGAISVASSSLLSLNSAQSDPVAAHQDIPDTFASPRSLSSRPATSLIELNTTRERDPHNSVAPLAVHVISPSPIADFNPCHRENLSVMPQPSPASVSQQSLLSPGATYIRMTQESRNVAVEGNNNNVNYMMNNSDKFMEKLWERTIQGAAFDSSDRDPPPRCHPETRLAVIARCLEFTAEAAGKKKVLWVVGQAGVGKSAIMQIVAESPLPFVSQRACIFLSINGRNDGAKIIVTLIYQLADQCEPYRQFVEQEITRHPSLLQSSMSVQFKKLLIEPFVNPPISNLIGHVLIIIDGLDECDKSDTQRELLRLIADVCSAHPSLSFVWLIASRPEHHIIAFFAQDHVQEVYEKEVIEVDSDEARRDVEKFLRAELTKIQKEFFLSPRSQWPPEQDFWKLASASGGLFLFAQTVIKCIGDPVFGNPTSQLNDVLKAIDARPLLDVPQTQHPLALLDTLYARILSKVPERIMVNTRKILLALVLDSRRDEESRKGGFVALCNWLGMTCDDAYAAIRHLGSVLLAPQHNEAHWRKLRPFHKSFIDYVSDFTRSGFSSDIEQEALQLEIQYSIRILQQAPEGIHCIHMNDPLFDTSGGIIGHLVSVPSAGSNIILTWSADEENNWSDTRMRLEVYKWAFANLVEGIATGHSVFCADFFIRIMISRLWISVGAYFPYRQLLNSVFEKSRSRAFIQSGILQRIPIKELDFTRMTWDTTLRFRRLSGTTNLPYPWNPSCPHERAGNWEEGKDEDWTTVFRMGARGCHFCHQRLEQQLENWITRDQDHDVTVLFTSAQVSFLEFQFIDPNDGVSEWTYWIALEILKEKRRKLGSSI